VPDGAVLILEPESTLSGRVLYTKNGSGPEIGQALTYERRTDEGNFARKSELLRVKTSVLTSAWRVRFSAICNAAQMVPCAAVLAALSTRQKAGDDAGPVKQATIAFTVIWKRLGWSFLWREVQLC